MCGYADFRRLGIDRWLAILAARKLVQSSYVVADLGTAATLDLVDEASHHCGGFIVPGLRSMTDSLFQSTADVHVGFEATLERLKPGVDTAAAVRNGVLMMLGDFIASTYGRLQLISNHRPSLLLCGGDAEIVAPHIAITKRIEPDLVFDGLDVALP